MIGRIRSSVVGRLVVSTIAVGVAMCVIVIVVLNATTRPALRRQVASRNLELAARLAALVDDRAAASVRTLRFAALDRGLADGSGPATSSLHVYLRLAPAAHRAVMVDLDGIPIAAAAVDQLLAVEDVPAMPPPSDERRSVLDREDGHAVLRTWVPVERPPGVAVGWLVASLRLDILVTQLETTTLGSRAVAYVIDHDGRLLVHPEHDRVIGPDRLDLPATVVDRTGGTVVANIDGQRAILAAAPVESLPVMIVVEESEAGAFASLGAALTELLQILVLMIAVTVAAIALVGQRLLRPLRALARAVDRLGKGDRSARVGIDRRDEVGDLARAFDRMADDIEEQWTRLSMSHGRLLETQERLEHHVIELERAHVALASSEERFRQLAEHINELFWMVDAATGRVLYVSPAYATITGRARQELYDDAASFLELVHPDDVTALPTDLDGLRDHPHDTEYRIVRDDGEVRWLWSRSFGVLDEHGRVYRVAGITEDITDRKRADETLRESERKLRALDELKNSFLTAVSHELRTPLASVVGFADTLSVRDGQLDAAQRRQFVERIARNARKLQRLLSDLLDLDRLERGIVTPRRRAADIAAIAGEIVRSELAGGRTVTVLPDRAPALIDPTMVERIVENLLANAVRHTAPDVEVSVAVAVGDDAVEIVVEDTGPGVPDELKQAIFEPFRQGGSRPHAPGVGVGLALVARFAELHGGRAWVEDRPGGGASFHVVLSTRDDETPIQIASPADESAAAR